MRMREGNRTDGGCLSSCLLTPDLTSQLTSLGSQSHLSNLNECLSRCKICHTQENILDFERNVCHSQTTSRDPKSDLTWQHLIHLTRLRNLDLMLWRWKVGQHYHNFCFPDPKMTCFLRFDDCKISYFEINFDIKRQVVTNKAKAGPGFALGGKYSRIETLLC